MRSRGRSSSNRGCNEATHASGDADALALADAEAKVQALEHATVATITTQQEMTRLAEDAVANAQGAVADAQTAVADAQTSGAAADSKLTAKKASKRVCS